MKQKNIRALAMTLVPSPRSFFISLGLGCMILVGHVLLIGESSGLLLPNLLQGDTELWGMVLVNWVEPIVRVLTENHFVATITIATLWAGIGVLFYAIISSTIATAKEARNLKDPTMKFYLELLGWHAFVVAIFVALSYAAFPLAQWLLAQDELFYQSATVAELLSHAGIILLGWIALFHAYVVLYRLYRRFYVS